LKLYTAENRSWAVAGGLPVIFLINVNLPLLKFRPDSVK